MVEGQGARWGSFWGARLTQKGGKQWWKEETGHLRLWGLLCSLYLPPSSQATRLWTHETTSELKRPLGPTNRMRIGTGACSGKRRRWLDREFDQRISPLRERKRGGSRCAICNSQCGGAPRTMGADEAGSGRHPPG